MQNDLGLGDMSLGLLALARMRRSPSDEELHALVGPDTAQNLAKVLAVAVVMIDQLIILAAHHAGIPAGQLATDYREALRRLLAHEER